MPSIKKDGYPSIARFSEGIFNHPSFPVLEFKLSDIFKIMT